MVQSSILKRLVGALLLLALMIITGCNSRGTDGLDTATYRIEGGMVVDLNRDSTYIATRVFRNDSTFTDAVVQIDNRVIPYSDLSLGLDSAYTLVDEAVATYLAEILPVILLDNSEFGDTLLIPAADSFSIEITDPALRLLQPLGNV